LVISVSQWFGNKEMGFNSCECIKFLNIANFQIHAFHVWGQHILSCNDATFFLHFSSFFCFFNATFFHSSYVIKPPQPSSAIYGDPPFIGHRFKVSNYLLEVAL